MERRDVEKEVELPGDVYPRQQAMLYARVSGYLETVNVDRGDRVVQGQLLASIRLPEAEREVSQAQALYARGQSERAAAFERLPRAEAERAAANADYQKALSQEQQLRAELQRSQALERQAREEEALANATTGRLLGIVAEDPGLIAAQELDVSRTALRVAQAKRRSAESSVAAAQQSLSAGRSAVAAARSRLAAGAFQVRIAAAQAEGSVHQNQAELEVARKSSDLLAYRELRAPFSGVITSRQLDPGALVQSSAASAQGTTKPILTVTDFDNVRVRVELPQALAPLVRRGTPAEVLAEALPDKVFHAPVARTSGSLDMTSRTMVCEVDVSNRDHLLHPGMYVKVRLRPGVHKGVLAVPASAVVVERSQKSVVVNESGKARKVSVKTGFENAEWVEVREGLQGGEQVVVTHPAKIANDTPLTVRE